jgi:hypothetical protein
MLSFLLKVLVAEISIIVILMIDMSVTQHLVMLLFLLKVFVAKISIIVYIFAELSDIIVIEVLKILVAEIIVILRKAMISTSPSSFDLYWGM